MLGTGSAVPIKRGLPCIAVKVDSDIYVFDVGEGCQQRMLYMGLGLVKVKAIFITHMHGDHYLGLFGMLQSMHLLDKRDELDIIAPSPLVDLINTMIEKKHVKLTYPYSLRSVAEGEVFSDNKIAVNAFSVNHIPESYGYEIVLKNGKRIVYTGDTAFYEKIAEISKNAELLIHESTFTSRDREEAVAEKHSTAYDAGFIASCAQVKQLVLTHISPRYSSEEVFFDAFRVFKRVTVAEDYMVLFL